MILYFFSSFVSSCIRVPERNEEKIYRTKNICRHKSNIYILYKIENKENKRSNIKYKIKKKKTKEVRERKAACLRIAFGC